MIKNKFILFFVFIICFQMISSSKVIGADHFLTIDTVRTMAIEASDGVQSVKIDKIKKDIELKQAQDGIADIRKKESTIRFSLLFNIKFPEKHGMPKEIELLMKVPEIENDITVLKRQEVYETLKSQTKAEQTFYDVVLAQQESEFLAERVQDSSNTLDKISKQYKTGMGKQADVDYMQNQLNGYEKEADKAVLQLDTQKQKLGNLIGTDVRLGYTFEENYGNVSITRTMLDDIITYAKENDYTLFQATQKRKLAEKDVETIMGIYNARYGGYMGDVDSYIRSHEGQKMDYDIFIQKYNTTLTQIDSPWANDFVINLLFFKIVIPKEWFKGEYSGTRYMEDQKYALFVSLVARDKARKEEQNAIKALEEKINDSYHALKVMDMSIQEAKENLTRAELLYKTQLDQNKIGLVDFSTLELAKDSLNGQQRALFELQAEYAKSLSAFNLDTAGYINKLLGKTNTAEKDYISGDSFVEETQWYIRTDITDFNFLFGVTIPDEYDVNYFQLFYNNKPIGNKISTENTLIHPSITYTDTELLTVKLYKDDELKYRADFEGTDYSGILKLQKAEGQYIETPIQTIKENAGQWKLTDVDSLRMEFNFQLTNNIDFDTYELVYQEKEIIGTAQKGKSFTGLKLYFNPANDISIVLKKENETVGKYNIVETVNGEKIMTEEKQGD